MNSRQMFAAFVTGAEVPAVAESRAPVAKNSMLRMLNAYGRNPLVVDFFDIYADLKDIYDSEQVKPEKDEEGNEIEVEEPQRELFNRMRRAWRAIDTRIDLEITREQVDEKFKGINFLLRLLDRNNVLSAAHWRNLIHAYAFIIQAVAADKKIFLSVRRLTGKGVVRWLRLQRSSFKEEAVEELRRDDPDLYDRIQEKASQNREIHDRIREKIEADGLLPAVRRIMRRPMNVGIDPHSKDLVVYDTDGDVLTVQEFAEKVKKKKKVQDRLLNVKLKSGYGLYHGGDHLKDFRQVPSELLKALEGEPDQYVSLTDDPKKNSKLTRHYAVKEVDGEDVISKGRFKGVYLSEMVSRTGRQTEGSSYYLDPATNRISNREFKEEGDLNRRWGLREPYVTVDKGKLLLRVPPSREWTVLKQELRDLAIRLDPSMEYIKYTGNNTYRFEAKDFRAVRGVIGTMALSHKASRVLKEYFFELSKAEQASDAKNLSRFSNEALGLKTHTSDGEPLKMRQHTKRALAWLDANGDKGICALDTGMGKTVTALASMLNLEQKEDHSGTNGKFMYVCEGALLGNFPKEVYKFMPAEEADRLVKPKTGIVDVTTYLRFNKARRADPTYGDDYIAIYFDEAHLRMKKKGWASYKSTVNVKCKHKILMTASPMAKSPREVLTMASIANNVDLNTKEGKSIERKFMKRFMAKPVGGRIVGVTRQPDDARDFRVWVKRNLFFANKSSAIVGEGEVKDLTRETISVSMTPEVEKAYRREMRQVKKGLREALRTFKAQPELAYESVSRALARPLATLTQLSDTPDRVIPGAPNPKIDQAIEIIRQNMGKRVLLWTDSRHLADDVFSRMRETFPGMGHVIGQTGFIKHAGMTGEEEKFTGRQYKDPETGRKIPKDEWKTFVLNKILGMGNSKTSKQVRTAVLTGSYAVGQNLQSFEVVVHLDRDDWNSETMKQRTARAWRAGNKQPVDEYTMDITYQTVADKEADDTLDEIRRIIQGIDEQLFNQVVLESQEERLGAEWMEIKKQRSALYKVNQRLLDMQLSPYAKHQGSD